MNQRSTSGPRMPYGQSTAVDYQATHEALNPQWQMIQARSRVLEEREEELLVACIRCGKPHDGPLSVCGDCDRHPRCTPVDELLAANAELELALSCERMELLQAKRLAVLLSEVERRFQQQRAIGEACEHLGYTMPDWQELIAEWRKEPG